MNLRKMYSTVILGMVVLLIFTTVLLSSYKSVIDRSRDLNQDGTQLIALSNDMLHTNDYIVKLMRVFVINNDPALLDEYYSLLKYENLEGLLDEMVEIGLTDDETVQVRTLYLMLDKLARIEALAIDAYKDGDSDAAAFIISSDEYASTDFQLAKITSGLISSITDRVNTGLEKMQNHLRNMELLIGGLVGVSISCLIVLQIMQRNRVLKPIVEIENIMQKISNGDVSHRLVKKHNDEIGSLFDYVNAMADSIEKYMMESKDSLKVLRNILNGINASIYVTVPETGEILFINEYMKKSFNLKDEVMGKKCYEILQLGMDKRCDFCPCFKLDLEPDETVVWEEHNTVTGQIYQNMDRYIDWPGGVKAHLQHSVDITEIKTIAEEKHKAEREVLEMKHEKEKAEASSKAKNDFLAKMSHEIRTPMNAVMGMSEIVLRKNPPSDIYEDVLGIKNASLNLLSIINDILDFSKIESGMMEITEADYQLQSLINDVISIIRVRLIDKPVLFAVDIDPNIPANLKGDEIRIRQMLINLLSNAVKYTKAGHIALKVSGVVKGNTVTLTMDISDSGIGVKEEDIERLFENFVQIDTVKNRGIEGTGLGLAISRSLCQMMGGDITLKSRYGEGSTFTVTLPQSFEVHVPFAAIEDTYGKSILLYETRQIYRDSLVNAFEGLGIPYKSVENISEFFDSLEKYDYAFVSSFMYGSIKPVLSKLNNPARIVILSDVTETFADKNVRVLTLPAHALSVANILTSVFATGSTAMVSGASFTAPDARVLIVDDVNANLKVCEGLLIPYEMQLTLCSRASEAIELVKSNHYDLVFMDHMMPEMDGLEVTGYIRRLEGEYFKNLPIVALTANAVSGVREMFIQNGMNDFLSKPIETAKLDVVLEKWIPREKRMKTDGNNPAWTEEENDFVKTLRSMPELSVDKALFVMGGSLSTYERVVKLSARLLPENIVKLNYLIGESLTNYSIEVHGIKGVLNNLGAYELAEKAFELEELSTKGDLAACEELHPHFIAKLTAFSDSMQAVLLDHTVTGKPKGNVAAIWKVLPQLEEAADFCDYVSALNVIMEINKYSYGKDIDSMIESLMGSFERFDFSEAIESLEQLKGGLKEWVM